MYMYVAFAVYVTIFSIQFYQHSHSSRPFLCTLGKFREGSTTYIYIKLKVLKSEINNVFPFGLWFCMLTLSSHSMHVRYIVSTQ